MVGIGCSNGEATLIVAIDFGSEVLGEEVTAMEVHLIDETVFCNFLNECAKG